MEAELEEVKRRKLCKREIRSDRIRSDIQGLVGLLITTKSRPQDVSNAPGVANF